MFDFEYKLNYPAFSYNLLEVDSNNENESQNKIKGKFKEDGFVALKLTDYSSDNFHNKFIELASIVGKNQVRDAARRISFNQSYKDLRKASVDPDEVHRPHSETSFSPARPAVIAFACSDIDERASLEGLTTIIDGFKLWKDLNIKTKNTLLSSEIEYRLSVDAPAKKLPKGKRPWFLEYEGVKNVELDGDNCKINFDYKTSFVNEHPLKRTIALANHSFINIRTEPQILNRMVNLSITDSKDLSFIRDDINQSLEDNIFTFQWKKGLILILDNFRFMHGRLPYNLELKRKLYILQFRNFNY